MAETSPNMGYEKFLDKGEAVDKLGRISQLADKMTDLDTQIAVKEAELKTLQKEPALIAEKDLPELFESVGVKELVTLRGTKLKLDEKVRHNVSKANKGAAYQWLEEHGQGGMVKNAVVVAFNKGQENDVKWFLELIDGAFPDTRIDKEVASSTLGAYLRQAIKDGVEVPEKTFGIFRQKCVEVA